MTCCPHPESSHAYLTASLWVDRRICRECDCSEYVEVTKL